MGPILRVLTLADACPITIGTATTAAINRSAHRMRTRSLAPACALRVAAGFATAPAANAATTCSSYCGLQLPAGVRQPAREYPALRVRQIEIDKIGTTNA